jgi:hypothetical protein
VVTPHPLRGSYSMGAVVAVTANTILSNTVGSSHAVQECKSVAPIYFEASTRGNLRSLGTRHTALGRPAYLC